MKTQSFTSKNVIQKLVNRYGLPAFLFEEIDDLNLLLHSGGKKTSIQLINYAQYNKLKDLIIVGKNILVFEDLWNTHQEILASKINWIAKMHNKLDARNCLAIKISTEDAKHFLDANHLMNYASSPNNYALIFEKQICAVASFSDGRKMNRLPEGVLGFELIRFATIPNYSITGGLSKLLAKFVKEFKPGDIMTYIDPLLGETNGFKKIGFIETEFTKPITLFVNKKTHLRLHKPPQNSQDIIEFKTIGNHKLVKKLV